MKKLAVGLSGSLSRWVRPVAVTGATALTAASVFAAPALAHDGVVESNPAANSTVDKLPQKITLTFSGVPQDGFNNIALTKDGKLITREKPSQDGKTLSIDVPEQKDAEPGEYTIGYQITSSDGHATRGSVKFTLAGKDNGGSNSEGSGNSADGQDSSQSSSKGEDPMRGLGWLLPIAGIVVIGGALVMAIARWRNLKDD
ncbi:copper resistance CopC family protein [uncultured Corynebacterium sp.]|uniref:copper resistance CopC family protein n=1 Tax=uncultured Corynebacterium sp. TaxID=159447 RepID=UPI0025FA3A5C|nr:copper resistance CopC family protein [uncultured Corynebacterium sp.]